MGYKNIEPIEVQFHDLLNWCGMFKSFGENDLGYGCTSKSKQKDDPGLCWSWDCPLCVETDDKDGDSGWVEQYRDTV